MLSVLPRACKSASAESEGPVFRISTHRLVKEEIHCSFSLKMSKQIVNIILAHIVAWMSSIKRHGHIVKVDSAWDERQVVGATIVFTLGRHVPAMVSKALIFIIIDNHEFGCGYRRD